jgi:hypothetical protein
MRDLAEVHCVIFSMTPNHGRGKVVVLMGLAALATAISLLLSSAMAVATSRAPVLLLGNAVGGARFATSEAKATDELSAMFGSLKTTDLKAIGWCGLTAQSTGPDVLFNFERGRFVGYEVGNASGRAAGQPDVTTTSGLQLGDTIAQAEKIYRRQFITSAAQGGSWKVKTPTGALVGLLVGPPMTGSTDQIDMIGAGDFGCAAMGP